MNTKLSHLHQAAIALLAQEQAANGSFPTLSTSTATDFSGAENRASLFSNALILSALQTIPAAQAIRAALTTFLENEASPDWTFNYWIKNSPEAKEHAYPNDLDDTFCALASLYQEKPDLFTGKALATITKNLTLVEEQPGGPYRTWFVSTNAEPVWRDVDLAVNCNIAYWLSLHHIELPHLTELVEKSIHDQQFPSRYYHTPYPVIYFITRWYQGSQKAGLIQYLQSQKQKTGWGNPLQSTLALISLLRLGIPARELEQEITTLTDQFTKEGFKAYALYPDPLIEGKLYYAGSRSLTAAFYLEMYALLAAESTSTSSPTLDRTGVERYLSKRISTLPISLRSPLQTLISEVGQRDLAEQIFLLPHLLVGSLTIDHTIESLFLDSLGAVSVWGWIAYSIYDDFLDGEGVPASLPLANISLRELTSILNKTPTDARLQLHIVSLLDKMAAANYLEVTNYRFTPGKFPEKIAEYPSLKPLADRSIGHTIGPLILLNRLGFGTTSPEFLALSRFFKHYLIARQLNDDAHDWKADLEQGRMTAVISLLLQEAGPGPHSLTKLEPLFWNHTLISVGTIIKKELKKARVSAASLKAIIAPDFFEALLAPIEEATEEALAKQKVAKEFIEHY